MEMLTSGLTKERGVMDRVKKNLIVATNVVQRSYANGCSWVVDFARVSSVCVCVCARSAH